MNDRPINVAPRLRAHERVVVHVDGISARWLGALALLSATCWLIIPFWKCGMSPTVSGSGPL